MEKWGVVILAAGLGRRLGGELPKVLQRTSENTLIGHLLCTLMNKQNEATSARTSSALPVEVDRCVIVTGHKSDLVEQEVKQGFPDQCSRGVIRFAHQAEQLGTGHAVRSAEEAFRDFTGPICIMYGDAPLLRPSSIKRLLEFHQENAGTISLLSMEIDNPHGYGRIIRDEAEGTVLEICEDRDCTPSKALVREVNQGTYVVDSAFLWSALSRLKNDNAQKEYYLTDIVSIAVAEGQRVQALPLGDVSEGLGVNDLADLSLVNKALNRRRLEVLQRQGVYMVDPESVWIDPEVKVGGGSHFGPSVQVKGASSIGSNVIIDGHAFIADCAIADNVHIKFGVVASGATISSGAQVGPFAHLREGTELGAEAKVGNFVETKKAKLEAGVKASHLSYLGDCEIGEATNIGAGTITCNYDGYKKSRTSIGKGVFIGSNSSLVAPVTIGAGATVGAGSVITKDVEPEALAVARATQIQKAGWAKKKRLKTGPS